MIIPQPSNDHIDGRINHQTIEKSRMENKEGFEFDTKRSMTFYALNYLIRHSFDAPDLEGSPETYEDFNWESSR